MHLQHELGYAAVAAVQRAGSGFGREQQLSCTKPQSARECRLMLSTQPLLAQLDNADEIPDCACELTAAHPATQCARECYLYTETMKTDANPFCQVKTR